MRRIQRYHALSVFGDMKPHKYDEAIMLGALHFANPVNRNEIWGSERLPKKSYYSMYFENTVKKLVNDGLLKFTDNDHIRNIRLTQCGHSSHPTEDGKPCFAYQISPRDYDIQITDKGRECLGMEQIARDGDYSFYKKFDGTIDSASKINPGLFKGK